MDRLEFEELALKSIDPSLGPTITHPTTNEVMSKDGGPAIKVCAHLRLAFIVLSRPCISYQIPLLYPSSATRADDALAHLRQYTEHRTPTHRRGFLTWLIIAPITAPFMIIRMSSLRSKKQLLMHETAVIPNLPFFFCVWRSWSHYRGSYTGLQ